MAWNAGPACAGISGRLAWNPHVFTVESLVDAESKEEFHLNPHGRYSHGRDYVEAVLRAAGFAPVDADFVQLRNESGLPVHGWRISAQLQT